MNHSAFDIDETTETEVAEQLAEFAARIVEAARVARLEHEIETCRWQYAALRSVGRAAGIQGADFDAQARALVVEGEDDAATAGSWVAAAERVLATTRLSAAA